MMKKICLLLAMTLAIGLAGCGKSDTKTEAKQETAPTVAETVEEAAVETDAVKIELSNSEILVDGEKISEDTESAVYKANDIIFYLEGQGIEYGDGTEKDAHSQIEADAHTVVYITEPGTYEISGTMEAGQIFVDLGDGTKNEEEAVATLILNNADITCTVAPAIFFYRTYECAGDAGEEDATMDVDTATAGANLVLAEGSKNKVYGSYVAEIYESCELNEEGTEVVDSKKLHKYDGAVYSRRSINISGAGSLEIVAENEGLCSEMHMTINGGDISIKSGNDGVNASEDNVSVFAMNDGSLSIQVTGETGEGDGIDSNGWLVINGGTVNSASCATSMDAGIDADKGIYINGGTVSASGNMAAEIAEGKQAAVSFISREKLEAEKKYEIKDEEENVVMEVSPGNAFTMLTVSAEAISKDGKYTLWLDDTQIAEGMFGAMGMGGPGMGGGMRPGGEMPEGMEPPEGFKGGERPQMPEGERPEGMEPPAKPEKQTN